MNSYLIKTPRIIWFIFTIIALAYIISFFNRLSNDDEGMIAEWGYRILKDGHASSSVVEPLGLGFEKRICVYHKLIAWLSVPVIALFGMKLVILRILLLPFLFLTLFIGYKLAKTELTSNRNLLFFLFSVIYLVNAVVFEYSFTFRPEIMLSALGFTGFYFINSSIRQNNNFQAGLAGILSALAFLTHLNGVAYLVAGFVLLLILKKHKQLIWFTIAGGVISLFYFIDMIGLNIYEAISHDLFNSPDVKNNNFTIWFPFIKLLNEHQRFFHSAEEIALSITFILSLIISPKGFFKNNKIILLYLAFLIITLGSLSSSKTPKYLIVYFPFIVYIIAKSLLYLPNIPPIKRYVTYLTLACFIGIQVFHISVVFSKSCNLTRINNTVFNNIPAGSRILAYSNLMFGGIDRYTIHSPLNFHWTKPKDQKDTFEGLLEYSKSINDNYVVITKQFSSRKYLEEINFNSLKLGDELAGFSLVYIDSEVGIYKLL